MCMYSSFVDALVRIFLPGSGRGEVGRSDRGEEGAS